MLDPREFWKKAASYPESKEDYYPELAAVQEFNQHTGKRVLEYGCGGGSDALSYLRRGNIVAYLDIVPSNVTVTSQRIAAAGYGNQAEGFALAASHPLPFTAESFDLVNADGVLHHIEDPRPIVREFCRVLVSGGLLYAMLYTEHLWAQFLRSGKETFGEHTDGGKIHSVAYTQDEGVELFQSCGFSSVGAWLFNDKMFRTFKCKK